MADTNFSSVAVSAADGLKIGAVKVPTILPLSIPISAASVDTWAFVATRAMRVVGVSEVHSVVGGAAAAVRPRKITDTSAPGASAGATVKELTTAAFDLTATINTTQTGVLSATPADLLLSAGDKIGLDFSGTLTGLVGTLTLLLQVA